MKAGDVIAQWFNSEFPLAGEDALARNTCVMCCVAAWVTIMMKLLCSTIQSYENNAAKDQWWQPSLLKFPQSAPSVEPFAQFA